MFSVLVLLTAVVCCNACRLVEFNTEDTTNSPGCTDSDGNLHEFYSDWNNEHETCVCVDFGIICCDRFDHTQPEPTAEIFYDNFGAFTDHDIGGNEEPSLLHGSGDEEQAPNQPDSSDTSEVISDSSEVIGDDFNESAENSE